MFFRPLTPCCSILKHRARVLSGAVEQPKASGGGGGWQQWLLLPIPAAGSYSMLRGCYTLA